MGVERFSSDEKLSSKNEGKRESGVVKIVGAESPEQEKEILDSIKEIFEEEGKLDEYEIDPEYQEIIKLLSEEIPKFAEQYGAEPIKLDENKLVFHKQKQTILSKIKNLMGNGRVRLGSYDIETQRVDVVLDAIVDNPLVFAHILAHEFLHFHSFQSLTAEKNEDKTILYGRRVGLRIWKTSQDFVYFNNLDEAVIEELTRRFDEKILRKASIPALRTEIEKREKIKESLAAKGKEEEARELFALYSRRILAILEVRVSLDVYKTERKKLNDLIKELYEKNREEFESEEDVFNIFAKASMSGNILPLARLIEKTFGKGSFRRLGEETGTEPST